ncbi:MAG: carbohydrate ABC transporter permease [Candidatus Promineifilaceae bacterium]|nr:carbohydrate ABC transporter permease [Candidatus Promineifilaceae bacterium]
MMQVSPARKGFKRHKIINGARGYAVLIIFAVLFMVPFYWMFATALKGGNQLFELPPTWIPNPAVWENFAQVFREVPFGRFLINSVILVVFNIVGQVISTTLVAYGFARLRFPGKNVLFLILLATMMVPSQVTLVPQFILFARLGWVNTYLPLILPAFTGSPFLIFLMRQYMMTIPMDLDESARIDGASRLQILRHIIAPIAFPGIVLVTVFTFTDVWTDFMGPLIYLNDPEKFTVTLGLSFFQGAKETSWHLLMAGSLMAMIPPMILFFIAQRRLLGGLAAAGIKG